MDPDFGEVVHWDLPLLKGYPNRFLRKTRIEDVDRADIPDVDRFLREERFDVVFLHGYTQAFARQLVRRKGEFGYRIVLHGEFTDMPRLDRRWWKDGLKEVYLRWFYRRVDQFCPIGRDALDHLTRRGVSEDRMTLTPYSVDDRELEKQRRAFRGDEQRRALRIDDHQTVFLFSGKLVPRKQPLLLAAAAATLAEDERLVVIYLGSGKESSELETTLRPVLGERLHLPGFVNQSQLGAYFAAADVFVLPSAYDTWGLVVNEAMHWGLPCIVSDRTGCRRDLVREGVSGFVHRWNSAAELAAHMRKFLDDPELAKRMGPPCARTDGRLSDQGGGGTAAEGD